MATPEEVTDLRGKIGELVNAAPWTDETLAARIDAAGGDIRAAAGAIWESKAAFYADLVNISEGGSSRANSQLHQNALAMAKQFGSGADAPMEPAINTSAPRTREAVRQ